MAQGQYSNMEGEMIKHKCPTCGWSFAENFTEHVDAAIGGCQGWYQRHDLWMKTSKRGDNIPRPPYQVVGARGGHRTPAQDTQG